MSKTPIPAANRYDCDWCTEHVDIPETETIDGWVVLHYIGTGLRTHHMCPSCARKRLAK